MTFDEWWQETRGRHNFLHPKIEECAKANALAAWNASRKEALKEAIQAVSNDKTFGCACTEVYTCLTCCLKDHITKAIEKLQEVEK